MLLYVLTTHILYQNIFAIPIHIVILYLINIL